MTPKVYGIVGSPPYAAVLMCAKVLGVKLDFEQVDLVKGEQFTEDFLKVNTNIFKGEVFDWFWYRKILNTPFLCWMMMGTYWQTVTPLTGTWLVLTARRTTLYTPETISKGEH